MTDARIARAIKRQYPALTDEQRQAAVLHLWEKFGNDAVIGTDRKRIGERVAVLLRIAPMPCNCAPTLQYASDPDDWNFYGEGPPPRELHTQDCASLIGTPGGWSTSPNRAPRGHRDGLEFVVCTTLEHTL